MIVGNLQSKRRIIFFLEVITIFWIIVIIRLIIVQFVEGEKWTLKAKNQAYVSRQITASRGIIYDRTEKNILAQSSSVETVSVNPVNISDDKKENVAKVLSEIFNLDYEKVLKKVKNNKSKQEIIVRKVDKETADKLRNWMNENNIFSGINIDEDMKRYYPYGDLASHIIGFVGSDNQGLEGIEAKYNDVLTGKKGSISKMLDAKGNSFGDSGELFEEAESGDSIVLTIDKNIQAITEKYLEEACIENECTDGGNVIIMDPRNGDILAMATYPNYNLNNPFEITNEEVKAYWYEMDSTQKNLYLQKVWRNKAVADTYEPGSTFKLVTTAAAIEEGLATADKAGCFMCGGSIEVAGVRIKCWRYYRPHGSQSLRDGLMNSCNPVFIGLGQKIGKEKYYDYLEKFGFLNKTGIDLIGEAGSIFLKEEKVGPVELATISFGQRFEVTPIQMIAMAGTIGNKGNYVKPRVVKKIIDSATGNETIIEPVYRDAISKETAEEILSMMTSVVDTGTGKNAKVEGYLVGGKTGTSEDGVNTGKYVTSFLGIAPTDNPCLTILVTLYNPTGEGGHQGGAVAAPVAGKILNEVISYLEL
ncbi:MAG: peptidoglycan glycosyltransferase [Clostridia bacterium]|nr:peptidoglycan glycosyltransferase [Clostridia bacterium]